MLIIHIPVLVDADTKTKRGETNCLQIANYISLKSISQNISLVGAMRRRRTNQNNFQERRRKHVVDKAWSSEKSEALPHTSHRPHHKNGADAIISFRFRSTTKYPLCSPVLQDGTRTRLRSALYNLYSTPPRLATEFYTPKRQGGLRLAQRRRPSYCRAGPSIGLRRRAYLHDFLLRVDRG